MASTRVLTCLCSRQTGAIYAMILSPLQTSGTLSDAARLRAHRAVWLTVVSGEKSVCAFVRAYSILRRLQLSLRILTSSKKTTPGLSKVLRTVWSGKYMLKWVLDKCSLALVNIQPTLYHVIAPEVHRFLYIHRLGNSFGSHLFRIKAHCVDAVVE